MGIIGTMENGKTSLNFFKNFNENREISIGTIEARNYPKWKNFYKNFDENREIGTGTIETVGTMGTL